MKSLFMKSSLVSLSFFVCLLFLNPVTFAKSSNFSDSNLLPDINAVSNENFNEIMSLEEELTKLINNKLTLEGKVEYMKDAYSTYSNQNLLVDQTLNLITEADKDINAIQEQMYALGAEKPSKEFLLELLKSSPDMVAKTSPEMSTFSIYDDMEEIIDTWEGMYNIIGTPYFYNGNNQYHLTFMYKGNDQHLSKMKTEVIYDEFQPNTTIAAHWVNDVLTVYAEKLVGTALKQFDLLPWELLFATKPSNSISSSGDATIASLNTLNTIKFVFVYRSSSSSWFFALSTSYVNIQYNVSVQVIQNNRIHENSTSGNITVMGDYNSSDYDANVAFNSGVSANKTLKNVRLYSKSKNTNPILINLHSPYFIGQMS